MREALLDDLEDVVRGEPRVSDSAPNVPAAMRPVEGPTEAPALTAEPAERLDGLDGGDRVDLAKRSAPASGFDPDAT
ncbi:hypothetical protein GCM10025868_12590 [Angustibacter aerolatus]|uniref:Uncharacterized protein n=1 Tax=Angustibacter aerolatus TaxID=1162965 RepID=A0ABQ6JDX8_9ACTN|nr:hypothetical protein GCM10025868_12590 [Angustibacter aerolatus]